MTAALTITLGVIGIAVVLIQVLMAVRQEHGITLLRRMIELDAEILRTMARPEPTPITLQKILTPDEIERISAAGRDGVL